MASVGAAAYVWWMYHTRKTIQFLFSLSFSRSPKSHDIKTK